MKIKVPQDLDRENARLAGVLIMVFGALVAALGSVMLIGSAYENFKDAAGTLTLVWGGVVIMIAGRAIRKNTFVKNKSRWFLAGSLFGVVSIYGVFVGISQSDLVKIALFVVMQGFSIYAIWRGSKGNPLNENAA